eukprot:3013123-Pyramimonas_sp.AAC.1
MAEPGHGEESDDDIESQAVPSGTQGVGDAAVADWMKVDEEDVGNEAGLGPASSVGKKPHLEGSKGAATAKVQQSRCRVVRGVHLVAGPRDWRRGHHSSWMGMQGVWGGVRGFHRAWQRRDHHREVQQRPRLQGAVQRRAHGSHEDTAAYVVSPVGRPSARSRFRLAPGRRLHRGHRLPRAFQGPLGFAPGAALQRRARRLGGHEAQGCLHDLGERQSERAALQDCYHEVDDTVPAGHAAPEERGDFAPGPRPPDVEF